MRKFKIFEYDEFLVEEIGVNYMSQIRHNVDESSIKTARVSFLDNKDVRKFTAFLDGTMKLYKVASAAFTGTPLHVATVSTALLVRGKDRHLRNTQYSRHVFLLLFPFISYINYLEKQIGEEIQEVKNAFTDLQVLLKRIISSNNVQVYEESDFDPRKTGVSKVFGRSGNWIICDTSFIGIMSQKGEEAQKRSFVDQTGLLNPQRVREAARSRARYIMGLLEFYSTWEYLKDNPSAYIMVDGLFYPYKRVKIIFEITREEYFDKMKNVIGFIKHPQDVPHKALEALFKLKNNEYIHWIGNTSEAEEDETRRIEEVKKIDRDIYKFVILRFRSRPGLFVPSPVGLVKLQVSPEEENLDSVVKSVVREKHPVPTDKRRLYNEAFPIEITEKVAKSVLPSESRIRGFVLSLIS